MPTQNIYDLVDTWNAGGTTFTSIKMNVTDTASNASSLLMDLQVGGASKFRVTKGGGGILSNTLEVGSGTFSITTGFNSVMWGSGAYGWVSGNSTSGSAPDTILTRRAAASLRLGAADAAAPVAQTLGVQSVVAGTTNTAGADFTIAGSQGTGTGAGGSVVFQVAPAGSSGTAQNALATALTIESSGLIRSGIAGFDVNNATTQVLSVQGTSLITRVASGPTISFALASYWQQIDFCTAGTTRWSINSSGHLVAGVDNTYDIGASGATRPRSIYLAANVYVGDAASGVLLTTGDIRAAGTGVIGFRSRGYIKAPVNSVFTLYNENADNFDRLQFGGTTSSFPALKRSSTTLQARLADDSAFAPVQGKLTTDTAYAAGDPTTTGYLVVYDSTGTAYKIPAVAV
jgi:hypothetical protein